MSADDGWEIQNRSSNKEIIEFVEISRDCCVSGPDDFEDGDAEEIILRRAD